MRPKSGESINALNSVLTPLSVLGGCLMSSLTKEAKSRGLGTSTPQPPTNMYSRQFAVSEKM
jgi:hypothetical protein